MIKFILGFATATVFYKNLDVIIEVLEKQIAKLELKRDILKHDNPELFDK